MERRALPVRRQRAAKVEDLSTTFTNPPNLKHLPGVAIDEAKDIRHGDVPLQGECSGEKLPSDPDAAMPGASATGS